MTDQRRAVLTAALGFLRVRQDLTEVATLRRYLDSWRDLGDVVVGVDAQALTSSSASSQRAGERNSIRRVARTPSWWRPPGRRHHGAQYQQAAWSALKRAA